MSTNSRTLRSVPKQGDEEFTNG